MAELGKSQKDALRVILSGKSVILSGRAGCGKTYLLKEVKRLIKKYKRWRGDEVHNKVKICAATGMIARELGGLTISNWCALKLGCYQYNDTTIQKQMRKHEDWAEIDLLVDDECFLHDTEQLRQIDVALRALKGEDLPFGGIQLVFAGDPRQLLPFEGEPIDPHTHELLSTFEFIEMKENYRQANDPEFKAFLDRLAYDPMSEKDYHWIKDIIVQNPLMSDGFVLCSNWEEANVINSAVAARLRDNPSLTYRSRTEGTPLNPPPYKKMRYVVGMKVLHTVNKNVDGETLVNGDIGVIIEVDHSDNTVQVDFGVRGIHWIFPNTFDDKDEDGVVVGSTTCIPLIPCTAMTVRRAMGLTLPQYAVTPRVLHDRSNRAQQYTALSRATSSGSIGLYQFKTKSARILELVNTY
jgi:ATP-dependent DNA helicase PIF1